MNKFLIGLVLVFGCVFSVQAHEPTVSFGITFGSYHERVYVGVNEYYRHHHYHHPHYYEHHVYHRHVHHDRCDHRPYHRDRYYHQHDRRHDNRRHHRH